MRAVLMQIEEDQIGNGQPHLNQSPKGPVVEMPAKNHKISNRRQHPLGNAAGVGLTTQQRAAADAWRVEYWKARAAEELARRGR